ncbi:MAG: GNAT family N-acetyltransferase [Methylobacter sp.]|nr:GNAT family N-acetyltransferase [Methylobacter sp.]
MPLSLLISKAVKQDANQIADLVNSAYRGESSRQGWTTEADFLDGSRTDPEEIIQLISSKDSIILVCKAETELVGSVYLQNQADQVCLGMLAVKPILQNQGIGKQLMAAAELVSQQTWHAGKMVMEVIPYRHELIDYYERRGYKRTGVRKAFPVNPKFWMPMVKDLCLEILEKKLYI